MLRRPFGSLLRLLGLLAVLSGLAAAGSLLLHRRAAPAPPSRPVTDARLLAADSAPGDWLTYGRDYANQRFSPLSQIDRRNVADLRPVWHFSRRRLSRAPDRNESTPLALDGMLIYSDSRNAVFALDARTGRLIWRYDHAIGPAAVCCGLVNRGVVAYGDAVYLATLAPSGGVTPPGDNLYSTSIVALRATTGQLAWYFQIMPHNIWDYEAASPPVLLSVERENKRVRLVAHAGKTGWVYLVHRETGAPVLRSEPLIPLKNIFPPPSQAGVETSPGDRGGSNWPPAAYSPRTGLLYVQATHAPMIFSSDTMATAAREGEAPVYAKFHQVQPPRETGTLSAIDPATGRIRWQRKTEGNLAYGGVLSTGGGLVFFGERDGHLTALDAETGETLWRHRVDDRVLGSLMAFAVDGEQRIAIASIRGLTVFGLP